MHNFYKTPDGQVHAFEDGTQDHLVRPDMQRMSPDQVELHRNPPPTPAQVQAQLTAAIQQRLDAFAQTRGYDNILSACTYAASSVPQFAAEGQCAVALRDATWAAAAQVLADVQSASRPPPTQVELLAELPALAWPETPAP